MAGPWEKYQKPQAAPAAAEGPWSKYQQPEAPRQEGLLSDLATGAADVARAVDSYTGAPARAAIGAAQDGKGFGGAMSALANQFGEDPSRAPTGGDIRRKAGYDFGDESIIHPDSKLAKVLGKIPSTMLANYVLTRASPNDVADVGIESAADLTNLIPVGGIVKRGAKAGVEALDAGLRGTGRAITRGGELAASGGAKVLAGAAGADEAAIRKYAANQSRLKDIVDTRSGISAMKDDMDATLTPLQERVGAGKERLATAKETRAEELARLVDAQREGKESLRLAEQQRLGETAARVSGDVQRLNKEVSAGSEKAFQILDHEGVRVPVTPIKSDLTRGIKALEATAITDEQMAVVDTLKRYRERLDKFGPDMAGGEAKRLIQSLDREMRHLAPGEVGRLGREDQVLGILRKRFDSPLKASPEYAKQMEGVAKDTRLLIGAEPMATEGGAARALQAAKGVSGADRAEVLRLLGERQGQNYLAAIDRSTLPEYQKLRGVLQRVRAARKGSEMRAAQAELDTAIGELAPFKGVAPNEYGKSGAEALIRNQLRPKTAGLDQQELINALDKKFGKNYASQVDDLKTIASFDKEFTRGSANTNFWAIAMAAAGTLAGGATGGVVGGTMGAAFGRMVIDRFGPQSARVILDQLPKLQRMAPTEWVKALRVPDAVKANLLADIAKAPVGTAARAGSASLKVVRDAGEFKNVAEGQPQDAPSPQSPDKFAARGLERLGITDHALTQALLSDEKGRQLLREASAFSPDSPAMKRIKEQIKRGWIDRQPARQGKGTK
jgi:hypothetical protein